MSKLPKELKYAPTHEWVRVEGDIATVGITDFAQNALGDVVYVELPEVGDELHANDEAGVVESVKAASDIYTPVTGTVVAINEELEDAPETINRNPYHDGWFFKIRIDDAEELEALLDAEEYGASLEEEGD
jgi:glycine cleavage system H protein